MQYSLDYSENVTLADGTVLRFRSIHPDDKPALVEAFAKLSAESRRRRFFTTKNQLSEDELRYLTECDGINHYAIVAGKESPGELTEGAGVARFVRVPDEPQAAELAIVVVDQWQNRGIGSMLLERLVRAAAERGIKEIRALALPDNEQIRSLLEHYADDVEVLEDHGMLLMTVHVPPVDEEDALDAMLSMLRYAAVGTFIIPIWLGRRTLQQLLAQMEQKDSSEDE